MRTLSSFHFVLAMFKMKLKPSAMAADVPRSKRSLKRSETKKSHSWWWDSHISPKNSKWLAENLQEMDDRVKQMLKLIEEDGDSFAKKAEMYYQKRPELIRLVEEFYRMYRSLAERYDNVTGELRRNIPFDIQSQGSTASDLSSEIISQERTRPGKSGPRAAGFDVFLGPAKSDSDACQRERDDSYYATDTESDSDESSINNPSYMGASQEQELNKKILGLEMELGDTKEKLRLYQEGEVGISCESTEKLDPIVLTQKLVAYEAQLKDANARVWSLDEELVSLKMKLQKYESLEVNDGGQSERSWSENEDCTPEEEEKKHQDGNFKDLKKRLEKAHRDVNCLKHELEAKKSVEEKVKILQNQLESTRQDALSWKCNLEAEKRDTTKLQERITMFKANLSAKESEVRDLTTLLSDAEQKCFTQKAQAEAEVRMLQEEIGLLVDQVKKLESRNCYLADGLRSMEAEKVREEYKLNGEIEKLRSEVSEKIHSITMLRNNLTALNSEKDGLLAEITSLMNDVDRRDKSIEESEKHLQELHMEHVRLIRGAKNTEMLIAELKSRVKDLEEEVETQRAALADGAEKKREVIRQLCFSLEHYRDGYRQLHNAFSGHRKFTVSVP